MASMTPDQLREFLSSGTKTGHLATVRADGSPHVVPIWFVLDGDDLVFNTANSSVKAKNMAREPRVSLSISVGGDPYPFVTILGVATLEDLPPEELLPWATRIGSRYMGPERADEFGARNATADELLVRVSPTRVISNPGVVAYE